MQNTLTSPLCGLHLDLKGVQYRQAYLPQLLADLASQGINAILLEYEDVFPFDNVDCAQDEPSVWSRQQVLEFQQAAARHGIEIIPLQQCLGHLQYLLRWEKYRGFAVNYDDPTTLNIDNPRAKTLMLEILRQVLESHPASRFVHLGLDEAESLAARAHREGQEVLPVFLEYLAELCALCESYGKTPLIWSDMLEDHLSERSLPLLQRFKERIVLCSWDYNATTEMTPSARFAGRRVSKEWLNEPNNPLAPSIDSATKFIEDLSPQMQNLVEPYRDGRSFTTHLTLDIWAQLGFRCMGASAVRASSDGAILPAYNLRTANIRTWSHAVKRTNALGHITTSWARGTTFMPPNFNTDLTWPLIGELSRSMGRPSQPFFEGLAPSTVDRIVRTLGRCRADWRLEAELADEMEALAPQLKTHRYEWQSLALMTRVQALHRRAEFALLEVDTFRSANRLVDSEWQRRIDEQTQLLGETSTQLLQLDAHFSQRYEGEAYREWLRSLFDWHIERLHSYQEICRKKLQVARQIYRAKHA